MSLAITILLLIYLIGLAIALFYFCEEIGNHRKYKRKFDIKENLDNSILLIFFWVFIAAYALIYNMFNNITEKIWFRKLVQNIINIDSMVLEEVYK